MIARELRPQAENLGLNPSFTSHCELTSQIIRCVTRKMESKGL